MFEIHIGDVLLAATVAVLGYFMRDRDRQLKELSNDLKHHLQTCAHVTPRERELETELMHERFLGIDSKFEALRQQIRAMAGNEGGH